MSWYSKILIPFSLENFVKLLYILCKTQSNTLKFLPCPEQQMSHGATFFLTAKLSIVLLNRLV